LLILLFDSIYQQLLFVNGYLFNLFLLLKITLLYTVRIICICCRQSCANIVFPTRSTPAAELTLWSWWRRRGTAALLQAASVWRPSTRSDVGPTCYITSTDAAQVDDTVPSPSQTTLCTCCSPARRTYSPTWKQTTSARKVIIRSSEPNPLTPTVVAVFVIFDVRALWRSALSVRVPGRQKLQTTD